MRLLVDANIFLEVILDRARADEARSILAAADRHDLFISAFSFHSIGVILFRLKRHELFQQFISDMILDAGTIVIALSAEDIQDMTAAARKFNLDFDDAYQYVAAEKYHLTIVSFDSDFDRTDLGRKTPGEVLRDSSGK